jgi:2-polyprenyl-3-methyl-5-hydroxy-6-metoxy-1,4-benzoquinol methylase
MSAQFWDDRSEQYDTDIRKKEGRYPETIAKAASLLQPHHSILDYGCASGEISFDLAAHAGVVHGIDTSEKMISIAKEKLRDKAVENVHFDAVGITDGSLAEGSFDVVVAFNILHLVENPSAVLSRIRKLLCPGGLLISQTPCVGGMGWFKRSLFGLVSRLGFVPNLQAFRSSELEEMVRVSGFEIAESTLWEADNGVQWITAGKI